MILDDPTTIQRWREAGLDTAQNSAVEGNTEALAPTLLMRRRD